MELRTANAYLGNRAKLDALFAEDGYVFFRNVLDVNEVTRMKQSLVSLLTGMGYVKPHHDEPVWTGKALIAGQEVPILGSTTAADGPSTAYVRPDGFVVGPADGPGFQARIRDVLSAGTDARLDCVLDDDGSIEVRVPHSVAEKLAPRNRISLVPREVRVWG